MLLWKILLKETIKMLEYTYFLNHVWKPVKTWTVFKTQNFFPQTLSAFPSENLVHKLKSEGVTLTSVWQTFFCKSRRLINQHFHQWILYLSRWGIWEEFFQSLGHALTYYFEDLFWVLTDMVLPVCQLYELWSRE